MKERIKLTCAEYFKSLANLAELEVDLSHALGRKSVNEIFFVCYDLQLWLHLDKIKLEENVTYVEKNLH